MPVVELVINTELLQLKYSSCEDEQLWKDSRKGYRQ